MAITCFNLCPKAVRAEHQIASAATQWRLRFLVAHSAQLRLRFAVAPTLAAFQGQSPLPLRHTIAVCGSFSPAEKRRVSDHIFMVEWRRRSTETSKTY